MVNNVFNKLPEGQRYNYPGNESTPFNDGFYSVYGRQISAQVKYNF
jgi:hypothetical protein